MTSLNSLTTRETVQQPISDEALGQLIVDNLPQSAWIKNTDSMYINHNNLLATRFGEALTKSMLGKMDHELPWESYASTYQIADKEVLSRRVITEYIHLIQMDDDHMIISTKKSILKNKLGQCFGVLGIVNLLWPSAQKSFRLIMDLDDSITAQSGYKLDQYILYDNSFPTENLTKKEIVCLFYLLRSTSVKNIAKLLSISPRTVETHIENIKFKLNCSTKSDLINKAIERNLLRLIPKDIRIQDFLVVKEKL